MKKPIIGLTGNFLRDDEFFSNEGIGARGQEWTAVANDFADVVIRAGGLPVIIPITADRDYLRSIAQVIDGLILTGGVDINPLLGGQRPINKLGKISPERDSHEIFLLDYFFKNTTKPIFGVCRGMQLLTIYFGGQLILDIPTAEEKYDDHSLNSNYGWAYSHRVDINKDSKFHEIIGKESLFVNSFHHQAAGSVPPGFKLACQASDGIIEAIEYENLDSRFIMATQWHPEMLGERHPDHQKLIDYFVSKCR